MTTITAQTDMQAGHLSRPLLFTLTLATGLAIANIYYNQPTLALMAQSLDERTTAYVPVATQIGYAAGLFFIVPFGDIANRKPLIVGQFLLLAAALMLVGTAPSAGFLVAASTLLGLAASVAQQLVPLAAHLSAPEKRGATVGTVMSGLLIGILLSRTLAGFIAAHWGWRAVFLAAAPVMLFTGLAMGAVLPRLQNTERMSYRALIGSMFDLWRDLPELRRAALTQAALFGAFSAFWTVLALRLAAPPFHIGAAGAGMFGVIGAVGVLVAPLAGRIADRDGPYRVIALGSAVSVVGWLLLGAWGTLAGMVVGVILLDFAVQSTLISHQHIIFALRPEARARINTLFMTTMFLGAAIGSAIGMKGWQMGGWVAVAAIGVLLSLGAIVTRPRRK
ncbi:MULTISPECIES: MFS transporter [Sphingomonas]|uniref:MFS transporter n=1 Tax=Sphingomonas TaxID=13687 RepID=UPI00254FDBFE|nr:MULTISPECIES: MFS transporter [Sphingomonas]MDK8186910.1 MFS transporter [Sphingomonas zeae]MDK8216882.1 MFS transporter [Sphingomonas sp. UMB7805-LC452B]